MYHILCALKGSNLGPFEYQSNALPAELSAHKMNYDFVLNQIIQKVYSSYRESFEFLTETVHLSHSHAQGLEIGSHPNLTPPAELSAHFGNYSFMLYLPIAYLSADRRIDNGNFLLASEPAEKQSSLLFRARAH